jgi:hypothetical protein
MATIELVSMRRDWRCSDGPRGRMSSVRISEQWLSYVALPLCSSSLPSSEEQKSRANLEHFLLSQHQFFDGCGFSGSSLDLAKSTWASLRSSSAQLEPNSWSAYIEALTRLGDLPTATLHQIRHPSTHSPSFPAPPLDLRGVALLIAQTRRMTRERKRHSLSPRDREGWERDLRTALGEKMERELDELMRSMFSQGARAPKSTSERRRLKKYDGGSSLLDCSDHMS